MKKIKEFLRDFARRYLLDPTPELSELHSSTREAMR